LSEQESGFRVSVVAPYAEGAIVEYARWAERCGNLVSFWLPSRGLTSGLAKIVPGARGASIRSRLTRGTDQVARVRTISPALEILRLLSRSPLLRSFAPSAMDHYKRVFDRAVSRRFVAGDAVVAMPGAAEETFKRSAGAVKVLHAVDGHPRAVNELLRSTFGSAAEREIVPDRRVAQIEREFAAADIVIVPSDLKRQQYIEYGVDSGRLVTAPYGVDLRRFFPSGDDEVDRIRPVLLYVGQISYRKGVPLLIDAARGLDVDVAMIGPVVQPALLRSLPLNITHQGAIAPEALNHQMNRSDALVLPSLEDAFGLVVLEALAAGLPVFTTDETGAAEVIGVQDGLVLPAGDREHLRTAMAATPILKASERRARAERVRATGGGRTWRHFTTTIDDAIVAARATQEGEA
jgi:glycosyltransferase involved in cell wall biosynthesis